jgi:hypothetical protein
MEHPACGFQSYLKQRRFEIVDPEPLPHCVCMKGILLVVCAVALSAATLHADDKDKDKDKGLPPGLQKKDKLPPGIAKKQKKGSEEAASAATATPATPAAPGSNVVAAPAPATTPAVPPPAPVVTTTAKPAVPAPTTPVKPAPVPERSTRELRADIDKHIQTVNTLDNKAVARRAGVKAIMKETGATEKTIENLRKNYPELGTGGLLIATEISAQTRKPAANFVQQRAEGKPWAKIAAEHQVKLDGIDAKLGRVETAMRAAR